MSSSLRVNTIVPSTGTNVAIGTANGTVTFTDSVNFVLGTGSSIFSPASNTLTFGTNDAERIRITSDGKVGINQASPDAMLQVDYDEGSSEVGLRLRAYNASGSKTWQLSEINGTPGVFTIRNATNAQNNLSIDGSSGYVGVNVTNPDRRLEVVETASSLTFPVAVSNHTDASAGVGAGIAFHLTAGGNTRGELGLVYAGNSNSDGTDFVFRPNDGSTGNVERLRIKGSNGRVGINQSTPQTTFHSTGTTNGQQATFGIDNSGLKISTFQKTDNDAGVILDAQKSSNGTLTFATAGTERVRITSSGNVNIGSNLSSNPFTYLRFGASQYGAADIRPTNEGSHKVGLAFYTDGTQDTTINPTERLRITSAGYVLKSDTPAFKCKLSSATGANFTGFLVFGNVSYNIGSHYNSSNGRFTAPVDGRYLFCWYTNMERAGGNGSFYAEWYINGNAQGNRMYSHHSGAWELIGGTVIFDLNANDYVHVQAMTSGNWDGGSYGSYSGYLLG